MATTCWAPPSVDSAIDLVGGGCILDEEDDLLTDDTDDLDESDEEPDESDDELDDRLDESGDSKIGELTSKLPC